MKIISYIAKRRLPAFSVFILCFNCFATIGSLGYAQPVNTPNASESKFNNTDKELENLMIIAEEYSSENKWTEAAFTLERIIPITEKRFGVNHLNVATILNALGKMYAAQGKYSKAEPLL